MIHCTHTSYAYTLSLYRIDSQMQWDTTTLVVSVIRFHVYLRLIVAGEIAAREIERAILLQRTSYTSFDKDVKFYLRDF